MGRLKIGSKHAEIEGFIIMYLKNNPAANKDKIFVRDDVSRKLQVPKELVSTVIGKLLNTKRIREI